MNFELTLPLVGGLSSGIAAHSSLYIYARVEGALGYLMVSVYNTQKKTVVTLKWCLPREVMRKHTYPDITQATAAAGCSTLLSAVL